MIRSDVVTDKQFAAALRPDKFIHNYVMTPDHALLWIAASSLAITEISPGRG